MKLITDNNKKNVLLIFLSLFFSIIFFNDQVAVRGGLIISKEIEYLNNISPLEFYFLNSWTFITQISAIFLKIGLSTKIVSFILVFFLTSILFFSCYYLLNKFIKNFYLSLSLTLFLIFFQKNLGDTDYPSLIFTIHTFGAYAQALVGLIFTCLIYNKLRLSFFFSFLLLTIHPIVGCWILSIIVLIFFILKKFKDVKEFLKIVLPGFSLFIMSISVFFYMKIESIPYDEKLFEIYMDKWDGHRAKTKEIHYIYIIKSLIVLAILNFFIPKKNENIISLWFLNLLITSSTVVYLLFKFTNIGSIGILSSIIPGRLMTTFTFISWPITLALVYSKLNKKKYINEFFFILIIFYSITHYKNFITIKKEFIDSEILFFDKKRNQEFHKLGEIQNTGNIITSENSAFNTLYISKKPVLLIKTIDYLPYHPYLVNQVSEILSEVYGYDFQNPPIKHYPYLSDIFFKETFERRGFEEWKKIGNKFNSKYIIVPKSWKLKLDLFFGGLEFNIYKII